MADPFTLAIVAAGLTATSELMGVGKERAVADSQAASLNEQARATSLEAGAAEEAQRRSARRQFGELRASGAEAGLLESGSFADAYGQAATMAELDALNIRYSGENKRRGLVNEAAFIKASKPSWASGIIGAGAKSLSVFTAAGGSFGGASKISKGGGMLSKSGGGSYGGAKYLKGG